MKIGVHVSMDDIGREDLEGMPQQLFIGSPLSLPSIALANTIGKELKSMSSNNSFYVLHASYLINLAAQDHGKRKRAVGMSKYTLKAATKAGCAMVVFHSGSGKPSSAILSIRDMLAVDPPPLRLLLENDAGGGKRIGGIKVLVAMKERLGGMVGFCFDTAHSYARGETPDLGSLKRAYDYCKPELIHLNDPDPKVEFGNHLDRHKVVLGEGKYGEDIFKFAHWVGDRCPMIVEASLETALEGVKRLKSYG